MKRAQRPSHRRLERALAWLAAIVAWAAIALGVAGRWTSGDEPGWPGPLGFASETVLAMWMQGGVLALLGAVLAAVRRHARPCVALLGVALLTLGPAVWARVWGPDELEPSEVGASEVETSKVGASGPASPDVASPTLRLGAVNLAGQNRADPRMQSSLRSLDAHVLVLSEFTTDWQAWLEHWFEDDYPHRWIATPEPEEGVSIEGLQLAIWSRLPAAGPPEVVRHLGLDTQLRVPLRWRGRSFVLYGLHLNKPWPRGLYASAHRGRREILARLRRESGPLVVAGDFNAPPQSAFLARLHELGMRSASLEALGYAPVTWPMHRGALAPFRVAIDHVLHGDELRTTGFGRAPRTHSDHAGIVADLTWRD